MENIKDVLQFWINEEEQNLNRMRQGLREFWMPVKYETNRKGFGGTAIQGLHSLTQEQIEQAISQLKEPLRYVTEKLYRNDDIRGAIRGALLHRYLFKDQDPDFLAQMNSQLGERLGKRSYVYQAIDELSGILDRESKMGS